MPTRSTPTRPNPTPRALRLGLPPVALLLVWLLWAWLGDEDHGAHDTLSGPVADVERGMHLDALRADDASLEVEPLRADTTADAPDDPAPDAAWPDGVERVCLTGRVVDARGAPWPGAQLRFLADSLTRADLKHAANRATKYAVQPAYEPRGHELDGLPRATADAEGRFEICGPRQTLERERASDWSRLDPMLLVTAAGMAWQGHEATGFGGRSMDVGDLVLEHVASSVVLRVVDELGRPLEGVEYRTFASGFQSPADDDPVPWGGYNMGLLGVTDARGELRIDHRWPSSLHGSLHKPGFTDHVLQLRMGLAEQLDLGDVVLSRGRSLSGVVVDPSGAPVAEARVLALHAERLQDALAELPQAPVDWSALLLNAAARSTMSARSEADGRFVLSGIPADMPAVSLVATAPGHRPGHEVSVTSDDEAVRFVLQPEARLHVQLVSTASGATPPGASLLAFRRTRDPELEMSRWLMYQFKLPLLALQVEGDVVHDPGPRGALLFASAAGHLPRRVEVEPCAPGEQRERIVELQPDPGLRGTVVDDLGAPVSDARVQLEPAEPFDRVLQDEQRRSADDGSFAFGAIPAAEWTGSVARSGHVTTTFGPVDSGQAHEPLELVLPRAARLPGLLLEAHGAPAVGAWVNAHADDDPESDVVDAARSDRDGQFEFTELTPGTWWLRAGAAAPVPVELVAGDNPAVELQLPPRLLLRGRTHSGGEPLAQVRIEARLADDDSAPRHSTRSAHDGTFRLELPVPGLYDVSCHAREGSRAGLQALVQPGDLPQLDIDFGTGRIAGHVVSASGEALPADMIVSLRRDETYSAGTRTDAAGRFEFAPLRAGSYRVRASSDGYLPLDHGPVELAPGQQILDLVCELQPATLLEGSVRWADGTPFDGYVHLRRTDGEPGYRVLELDDGLLYDYTIASGAWRLDLATFWEEELGVGEGLRGEPGAELPFFAERTLQLEPGQTVELAIVIPLPEDG